MNKRSKSRKLLGEIALKDLQIVKCLAGEAYQVHPLPSLLQKCDALQNLIPFVRFKTHGGLLTLVNIVLLLSVTFECWFY